MKEITIRITAQEASFIKQLLIDAERELEKSAIPERAFEANALRQKIHEQM